MGFNERARTNTCREQRAQWLLHAAEIPFGRRLGIDERIGLEETGSIVVDDAKLVITDRP